MHELPSHLRVVLDSQRGAEGSLRFRPAGEIGVGLTEPVLDFGIIQAMVGQGEGKLVEQFLVLVPRGDGQRLQDRFTVVRILLQFFQERLGIPGLARFPFLPADDPVPAAMGTLFENPPLAQG